VTLERAALLALALGALLSARASFEPPHALSIAAALATLAATLVPLPPAPRALTLAARGALGALLLATGVFGLSLVLNPTLSDQAAHAISTGFAAALAVALPLCLAGAAGASPLASTIPAALGLLVVAAFRPRVDLSAGHVTALLGAIAWLAVTARRDVRRGAPEAPAPSLRRRLRDAAPAALEVALALGIALAVCRSLPLVQERFDRGLYELAGRRSGRTSGFTRESRLGDLASLKLSDRVILRVFTETPQYLRGRVFTVFDGATWRVKDGAKHALPHADPDMPVAPEIEGALEDLSGARFVLPGREAHVAMGSVPSAVVTRVIQVVAVAGTLLAPGQKALVLAPVESILVDDFENLEIPVELEVESFATVNRPGAPDARAPDAGLLAACLLLPERGIDPRFAALAEEIARAAPTVEERIARTAQRVSAQCRYSLEPGAFTTTDPVAEFFFEKRRGYCQYFASAAALLLRAQGVPCRYVTGFAVSVENYMGGHFVVREHDAHAWLEAYVPGRGWIEVDPTPALELATARGRVARGPLAAALEWLEGARLRIAALLREADLRAMTRALLRMTADAVLALAVEPLGRLAAALVAAGFLVRHLLRRRARRRAGGGVAPARAEAAAVPPRLTRLLAAAERTLAEAGRGRPPSRAPREHLEAIPADALTTPHRDAVARIIDAYYAARYGGAVAGDEYLALLEGGLRAARIGHHDSTQKSAQKGLAP